MTPFRNRPSELGALLLLLIIPLCGSAVGQLKDALKEPVNLAPKAARGSVQFYTTNIKTVFLDAQGAPAQTKEDRLNYTQLCLGNSPDTGVVYQITIDSLMVGQKLFLDDPPHSRTEAEQFTGKSFTERINREIQLIDGCYALDIDFLEGERFIQSYELEDMFILINLLEQARYLAGRGLRKIGDKATINLPAPICYTIPQVVDSTRTTLSSFDLTLEGLTLVGSEPCAQISVSPHFADFDLNLYAPTGSSTRISGTFFYWGEFRVRLSDGDIVYARINTRADGEFNPGQDPENGHYSRSYRLMTLTQRN